MVRSVKSTLKGVGKAIVTFEELQTILCEIEEVLNSRPLVYVSEDDLHESLTPFHLMYGRHISKKKRHTSDEIPLVGFRKEVTSLVLVIAKNERNI